MIAFLSALPVVGNIINMIVTAFFNAKVTMYTSRWGVTRDVAITAIQAEATNNTAKVNWLATVAKSPFLSFIIGGFATPYIVYEWKCIVYDTVWMDGMTTTPPIRGNLADWGTLILTGIFITTGGLGIAHAVLNKG